MRGVTGTSVHVVVLAGGGGTRLWPASRRRRPKQFLPLSPGGQALLAATVERVRPLCSLDRVLVVTAESQAAEVAAALPGLPQANVIVEPVGRNTAPAIALAAHALVERGQGQTVMAVLPSDHVVTDPPAFRTVLGQALEAARDHLVTIGIRPSRPETGYGYLELGDRMEGPAREVRRFVEKPDAARAREYLASGRHLWNSGMFFFRAERLLEETRRHLPEVTRALETARYTEAPAISIDYGIMERASDILAVPGEFGWNDVGSWAALADVHPADPSGNVRLGGPLVAIGAERNVVYGDRMVVLLGVEDLVVVTTDDVVLVLPRARAQDVRAMVDELERRRLGEYL
jgi:mannose-1-phosphate guanylyltransferase